MTRPRRLALVLLAGLLLAFSVSGLDALLFAPLDAGQPPIRRFVSDQHYYLLRAHRVLEEGRPIGGAYFDERLGDRPRYVLFETALSGLGRLLVPALGTNPVVWSALLRFFGAFGGYLALVLLFRRFARLGLAASSALAALVVLWFQIRILHMGNALNAWYLPFALAALAALRSALRDPPGARRVLKLASASLLFLTHPIAYATGTMTIGLALLLKLRDERTGSALAAAACWTALAAAIGLIAYGGFAAGASTAAGETLARNLFVPSRLPGLPLTSLWVAAFLTLVVLLARRAPAEDRSAWQVVTAAVAAGLLGLNLNVLTGAYFLNDHYGFLLPLMPPLAAAMAFRIAPVRPRGLGKAAIAIALAVLAGWSLRLLSDGRAWHEARAFAHLGTILSFFVLGWAAWGRAIEPPRRAPSRVAVAALIALAALLPLASAIAWLDGYGPEHYALQKERDVLAAIERLPPGVVLSDPAHAETVAGYAPHRAYWSALAYGDDASAAELKARWRDALRFFPERWDVSGSPIGTRSLYGHMDLMCLPQWTLVEEEHAPYRFLEKRGFRKSLCRPGPDEAEWKAFVDASRHDPGAPWAPSFRLDYLLIDRADGQRVPPELAPAFERVAGSGPIEVYRYRPGR